MIRFARTLGAALLLGGMVSGCALIGKSHPSQRIFVTNYEDDTISVVEGDPELETHVIPDQSAPIGVAVRQDPPLLAVANTTSSHITLIDPVTLQVVRTVEVGRIPEHLLFSGDGKRLYVTLPAEKRVAVVDPDAGVLVGAPIEIGRKPKRLLESPDGRRLYVLLHTGQGAILVYDTATRQQLAEIPVGMGPLDFGMSRDGRWIVAANFDAQTITTVDTQTLAPVATYPVTTGIGIAVHPTEPLAYSMDTFSNEIYVVNYRTGEHVKTIAATPGPTYSSFTPDGRYLYVPDEDSNTVVKIDTEKNEIVLKIAVGSDPRGTAVFTGR